MRHFAVISPPFLSHLRAMEAIACELLYRGHRVTVVQQADVAAGLRHPAVAFAQVGGSSRLRKKSSYWSCLSSTGQTSL